MIKELINFTQNLDEDFKNLGIIPREGLHIVLSLEKVHGGMSVDTDNYQYAIYSKKMENKSELLERCQFLSQIHHCLNRARVEFGMVSSLLG